MNVERYDEIALFQEPSTSPCNAIRRLAASRLRFSQKTIYQIFSIDIFPYGNIIIRNGTSSDDI